MHITPSTQNIMLKALFSVFIFTLVTCRLYFCCVLLSIGKAGRDTSSKVLALNCSIYVDRTTDNHGGKTADNTVDTIAQELDQCKAEAFVFPLRWQPSSPFDSLCAWFMAFWRLQISTWSVVRRAKGSVPWSPSKSRPKSRRDYVWGRLLVELLS